MHMKQKIRFIKRLSKPDIVEMGQNFTSEQLSYCDVPVFKVLIFSKLYEKLRRSESVAVFVD